MPSSINESATSLGLVSTLNVSAFVPGTLNWDRWLQRLETSFTIIKTAAKEKAAYLLHFIGEEAFNTLCDNSEADVSTITYDRLKEKLGKIYAPALSQIAENFKFNSRRQLSGESIQEFTTSI